MGNVLVTVSDKHSGVDTSSDGEYDYYQADVVSASDYYPFGMQMVGRTLETSKYRYGFNGQEKSDELTGSGNSYTAEFWQYDARIGRRWNVDIVIKTPLSGYSTFANNPVWFKDPNGADSIFYNQDGTEIKQRRVKVKGDHIYFLQHDNGNKNIAGQKYYQGESYYSFFGDPDRFSEPNLFTTVDATAIPTMNKETIKNLIDQVYDKKDNYLDIFKGVSTGDKKYDYKNGKLFNKKFGTEETPSNISTAYMIDGVLYNRNEAGLILWGATLAYTSVGYTGIYLDNKMAHHLIEGNGDELNEMNMWRKGWLIMKNAKDVDKYKNTFMYGVFGIHYDKKVQGVDPTHEDGIYYDNWKIIGHGKK